MATRGRPVAGRLAEGTLVASEDNPTASFTPEWSNQLASSSRTSRARRSRASSPPTRWEDLVWWDPPPPKIDPPPPTTITLRARCAHVLRGRHRVHLPRAGRARGAHQGLCSPWQNDFRECSCYYWASARPDFVNVETTPRRRSTGDNWLQKERTGTYVPDDYLDDRLLLYDDLMGDWERWLRFQVRGPRRHHVRRDGGFGSVMTTVPVATPTRRDVGASRRRVGRRPRCDRDRRRVRRAACLRRRRQPPLRARPEHRRPLGAGGRRPPAGEALSRLGLAGDPFVDDRPLAAPPLHAISLAVAQKCNLGCTYCYAQQGDFGWSRD